MSRWCGSTPTGWMAPRLVGAKPQLGMPRQSFTKIELAPLGRPGIGSQVPHSGQAIAESYFELNSRRNRLPPGAQATGSVHLDVG